MAALTEADRVVLARLGQLSGDLRDVACTIARLGVRWRRLEPERAAAWIEALETHPFYKLGQVMFDLLEWEDFMLDEPSRLADPDRLRATVNRVLASAGLQIEEVDILPELPTLEPGFYLYRDVVLGLIWAGLQGVRSFESELP